MPVAGIQADQAISQEAGLPLGVAAGGGAPGLDGQPGMGHKLGPFVLPVVIGAGSETGNVGRGHVRGNGGSLQLGPVVWQQLRHGRAGGGGRFLICSRFRVWASCNR